MKLTALAGFIPFDVERDGDFENLGLMSDEVPGLLVCLYEARAVARELQTNQRISCVITTAELAPRVPDGVGVAVTEDPQAAFLAVHDHLRTETSFYGEDFVSEVSPESRIDPEAHVASRNVRIGRGTVIEPHATVLEGSTLGDEVVVRAGVVVGADGFHPKLVGGRLRMIPHVGGVRIGNHVEILANSVICRCTFRGCTEIGDETKIGALVSISHNVRVGRRCRIAAGAVVAGSARIGDDVWIGPNATISNLVRVGDHAAVSLGAVVVRDVPAGERVTGNLAVEHSRFLTSWTASMA